MPIAGRSSQDGRLTMRIRHEKGRKMKKSYVSNVTGEVVDGIAGVFKRLVEKDWSGKHFLNLSWKVER